MVNRHPSEPVRLSIDVAAGIGSGAASGTVLSDADIHAVNTASDPDRVRPRPLDVAMRAGRLQATLPAASWAMLGLQRA